MKQAFELSNENIQSLADRFEISNLLLDLSTAIDTHNRAALENIFAANARVEESLPENTCGHHQISNADIHIEGDTAIAKTLCYRPVRLAARAFYYIDKFRRTEEGWRIVERASFAQIHD